MHAYSSINLGGFLLFYYSKNFYVFFLNVMTIYRFLHTNILSFTTLISVLRILFCFWVHPLSSYHSLPPPLFYNVCFSSSYLASAFFFTHGFIIHHFCFLNFIFECILIKAAMYLKLSASFSTYTLLCFAPHSLPPSHADLSYSFFLSILKFFVPLSAI